MGCNPNSLLGGNQKLRDGSGSSQKMEDIRPRTAAEAEVSPLDGEGPEKQRMPAANTMRVLFRTTISLREESN